MKNIYLTPTKIGEGRLFMDSIDNKLILKPDNTNIVFKDCEYYNVNIISDEKIKRGDWVLSFLEDESYGTSFKIEENHFYCGFDFEEDLKKIILTTDQELINDGVQAIDDEFLEWFVNNPSCEKVEVVEELNMNGKNGLDRARFIYKIIIPKEESKAQGYICPQTKNQCDDECCVSAEDCHIKASIGVLEEPKQETLEEASWKFNPLKKLDGEFLRAAFIKGAKWQAERMYSEEDLREVFNVARHIGQKNIAYEFDEWFDKHKKKV
jgi:hypothetical protein